MLHSFWATLYRVVRLSIPGGPIKESIQSIFFRTWYDQQLSFFTLLDRASFPHYNNTKIIKFGWELFMLWVISYGLSFSGFAWFQSSEARLMTASAAHAPTHTSIQPATKKSQYQWRAWIVFLLGNTRSTEHNTRSIYGRPKLSLIVPRNTGNRANPENDSP